MLNRFCGLYDGELIEAFRDEVGAKADRAAPWAIYVATMDTHGPFAGVSPKCTDDGLGRLDHRMELAVECVSKMIASLVSSLRWELGDTTVIVVNSDHLAHAGNLTPRLPAGTRRHTLMVFAPWESARLVSKPGSMFGLYPTVLDILDFPDPEDPRAGLGFSPLSASPTLVEEFGAGRLTVLLRRDGGLARLVWPADEFRDDTPGG